MRRPRGRLITDENLDRLYAEQDELCAICEVYEDPLHVDHDHLTGMIRGLLCRRCNTMLGHYHESFAALERDEKYDAVDYLDGSRRHFLGRPWPPVWIVAVPERNLVVARVGNTYPVRRVYPDVPIKPWSFERWVQGRALR